jgi:cephalosporin hydroxylase
MFSFRKSKKVRQNQSNEKHIEVLDTAVVFGLKGFDEGHHHTTYRGVPCVKAPFDYVIYQMIIEEVKPDLIIEIGTYVGGSALYLADLLELNGKGEVHTIDVEGEIDKRVQGHNRISFFRNGWENYDLSLTEGKKVLVIEDGTHRYKDVLNAMIKFAPVVTVGSYLIVEDGIIDALGLTNDHQGGPVKAIKTFLADNNNFQLAINWCDFYGKNATFNTIGYLKRVS